MEYAAPRTVDEATALLAGEGEARVLAGGTDLLAQMHGRRASPALIVDIKKIPETTTVTTDKGHWLIGAAACAARLGEEDELARQWPGVVEAAGLIGSTQIQSRASLGGNLCNASPAADAVPALIAAGARCLIAGPGGRREADVADIATGPGTTGLARGEFVVAFRLPVRGGGSADAYLRLIPRSEMDIAIVGAGVNLSLDEEGRCSEARVALGAVAPRAILLEDADSILRGTRLEPETMEKLHAAVEEACRPIDDKRGTIAYRRHVAAVLACRAAGIARERAAKPGGEPRAS